MISKVNRDRVRGLTLIELLIVISIMVLLAAVSLPSFKATVHGRKPSQAAIQVKSFFEAARARAIGKQREIAVVIERASGTDFDPVETNTAYRVSLAEVLPPYRGDIDSSTCALSEVTSGMYANGFVNQAFFDFSQNPSARYFLNVGDLIAFDDRSERYEIMAVTPSPITMATPAATIVFSNGPKIAWNGTAFQSMHSMPDRPPVQLVAGAHRFRIYAKPRRLFSKPVVLPKGTCIDLSLSGFGRSSTDFLATDVATPIYLVFSPNGGVSSLFAGQVTTGNPTGQAIRVLPPEDICLFVGRSDQVVDRAGTPESAISERDEFKPNLNDSSCFWLRINPDSGQIATSPNSDPVSHGIADPVEQIIHARGFATVGVDQSAL